MDTKTIIDQLVEQVGFDFVGECTTKGFRTQPEVRNMCAANLCQHYDKSWSCPPACGDIEEYEQRMRAFDQCVVVQSVGQMEDPYDFETVMETAATQDDRFRELVKQLQEQDFAFMPLGAGACMLCSNIYVDDTVREKGGFYPLEDYENHRHFYACYPKNDYLPKYALDLIEIFRTVLSERGNSEFAGKTRG